MLTIDQRTRLKIYMGRQIVRTVEDPAHWLRAVREIAEAIGLDVTRCIPCGCPMLYVACDEVVTEAGKQERTEAQIIDAITGFVASREMAR